MIIDSAHPRQIKGIKIQGIKDGNSCYVSSVKVQVSSDKETWVDVDAGKEFDTATT